MDASESSCPDLTRGHTRQIRHVASINALPADQAAEGLTVFEAVPKSDQVDLWSMLHVQTLDRDEAVFDQGDPAERIYVVRSGRIDIVFHPDDGGSILVASLKSGGVLGLSSALGRANYTSGAVSTEPSMLVWIAREDLRRYCKAHPEGGNSVLEKLAIALAGRLGKAPTSVSAKVHRALSQGCALVESDKDEAES